MRCVAGAMKAVKSGEAPSPEAVKLQWHKWVAVRDAHCAGHPWRYSKHQLAYHYTQGVHWSNTVVLAGFHQSFTGVMPF